MNEFAVLIAKWLLQINAIKLSPQNPFTWSSGLKSPIYCDNRMTLSHPSIRKGIVAGLVNKVDVFSNFEVVAGVATAGIPHGILLAEALNLPFIYVRSKAKSHGRQNQIEGRLQPNQKVLVVEDLISTGGSSLQAVEALRKDGAIVVGVLAIFSYGFNKAIEAFEQANCPFTTLTNYETLLEVGLANQAIDKTDLEALKKWQENPTIWSENFQN